MLRRALRPRPQFSPTALLGIVCIALVLMSGMIQVAHTHPSGQLDHDCSLCITAHHVIQAVALVTLDLSSQLVSRLAPEPAIDLPSRNFFFQLSCRPPPAAPAFA